MGDMENTMVHLEAIWKGVDAFYGPFSAVDWAGEHGRDWTYADMPYHLAYFNQTILEGLHTKRSGQRPSTTLRDYNNWNNEHFGQRQADQLGAGSLAYLHQTQQAIRQAIAQFSADTPVFLPMIIVGGWRTLSFALEYLFNHAWLHLVETHLRYTNQLPALPADVVHHALQFMVDGMAGALLPEDLKDVNLVTILRLTGTGGGTWTFTMRNGSCQVEPGAARPADAEISSDIATYMKTSYYHMQHPLMALLLRKTRIKGMRQAMRFQKLFEVTPTRVWNFIEGGSAEPG